MEESLDLIQVIVTDYEFPSLDIERGIIEGAGFTLAEASPHCRTEDDVIRSCGGADVLLVQWAPVTRRVLEALPRVRCIVRYGVGVNNFDLDAAKDLGVTAANVPDFCVDEVSDHAMAMILSLVRRIPQDHNQIVRGEWGITRFRPIPAPADLTLGLVSFGKIARRVAEKAAVFGFGLAAWDPYLPAGAFDQAGVKKLEFDELIATSDIISLHCPLVTETQKLINADVFARMKDGAILINTSRGPVVDEAALIDALRGGRLKGAGLDVFEAEPLPGGSPLRGFDNVILTSHAASASERAVSVLRTKAAGAALDFLQGRRPVSALV
jgi:D-3-phosphoglycerate dehydrogenase